MRHGIAGNTLSRNQKWRQATVRDLAKATLKHQRISTTSRKAKEARKLVDQLITLGKKGTLAHKRRAFSILCDHKLVSTLFNEIAKRFNSRNGGYTRIIPLATNRRGDNAQMVYLELTEKTEVIVSKPKTSKKGAQKAVEAATVDQPIKEKTKKEAPVKEKEEPKKAESQAAPQPKHKGAPHKDDASKTKGKPKMFGGIKKMFNKKPPQSK